MSEGPAVSAGMAESFVARRLPDHCSEDGARALVGRLMMYWKAKGAEPKFRLERISHSRPRSEPDTEGKQRVWCIRSDMVGGVPAR